MRAAVVQQTRAKKESLNSRVLAREKTNVIMKVTGKPLWNLTKQKKTTVNKILPHNKLSLPILLPSQLHGLYQLHG